MAEKFKLTAITKDGLVCWSVDERTYVYSVDAGRHGMIRRFVNIGSPGKAFNLCKRVGIRMYDVEDEIRNVSNPIKRYHFGPVLGFFGLNKNEEPTVMLETKTVGGATVGIQLVGKDKIEHLHKRLGQLLKGG